MKPSLSLLLIAFLLSACHRAESPRANFHRPPIIIISIDTLRADHLPAYGYTGVQTPAIDDFRRDAILFRNAYAHVPMTLPSHVSILTGLLPPQHGVRNNLGYDYDSEKHESISRTVKGAGYATGAAISAYVLRGSTGLGRAFDFYDDAVLTRSNVSVGELWRPGDATVDIALGWVRQRADAPFFLLLHIFEPHAPYEPPEPFKSQTTLPYDGEIAASDAAVGRFLSGLKETGVYDRATIILLSDHGEGLGDHGEGEHGVFLYRESIHVPLLVKLPKSHRGGTSVDRVVQLVDVAPTIAEIAGVKGATATHARSLLNESEVPGRRVYSETFLPRVHFGWSELRSLLDDRFHYIEAPRPELYDIKADPAERVNVLPEQRRAYAEMKRALEPFIDEAHAPGQVSAEEAANLAALGYIGMLREAAGELPDPKDHIADIDRMKKASQSERRGDVREAISIYKDLLQRNPRLTDGWVRLAIAHERLGELQRAVDAYRHAIATAPSLTPGLALSLGHLLLKLKQYDDAETHARLALQRSPGGAHILLGRIALGRGNSAVAEQEARLGMADLQRTAEAGVLLAQVLSASSRPAEALRVLDSIPNATGIEDLEATRGDALARLDRKDDAERAFRAEIAAFPHNTSAYTRLAILHVTQGRLDAAGAALEEMVRNNPNRRSALLAAATWRAVGDGGAAARWQARAERMREP